MTSKKAELNPSWMSVFELAFHFNFGASRSYGFIAPGYSVTHNQLSLTLNTSPADKFKSTIISQGMGATIGIGYLMSKHSDLTIGYSWYALKVFNVESSTNRLTNFSQIRFKQNSFKYDGVIFNLRFHF